VISHAKFGVAHKGSRSAPPTRWIPGISDTPVDPSRSIFENVNDQAAIIIQIESELGVQNLDAILAAVGDQIDAVWIGALDLRVSMGLGGFWGAEPEFLNLVKLYEETLKKHNMPNSGLCLNGNWAMGANKAFLVVGGDVFGLLGEAATIMGARQNIGPMWKGGMINAHESMNGAAH
jgi:4-hydroxy-2-oxoheptanedioate aldolase